MLNTPRLSPGHSAAVRTSLDQRLVRLAGPTRCHGYQVRVDEVAAQASADFQHDGASRTELKVNVKPSASHADGPNRSHGSVA